MKCAICGKAFTPGEVASVRESWKQAGGCHTPPEHAMVHMVCNMREQHKLMQGLIRLADIWPELAS